MDSVLPSVLGITVLIVSSLVLGRSGFTSFRVLSDSWQRAEEQSIERLQSDISITSINRTANEVDVTVQNDGATPAIDFSKMDLVIQTAPAAQPTRSISHSRRLRRSRTTPGALWRSSTT
jgi:hypothetical protein